MRTAESIPDMWVESTSLAGLSCGGQSQSHEAVDLCYILVSLNLGPTSGINSFCVSNFEPREEGALIIYPSFMPCVRGPSVASASSCCGEPLSAPPHMFRSGSSRRRKAKWPRCTLIISAVSGPSYLPSHSLPLCLVVFPLLTKMYLFCPTLKM